MLRQTHSFISVIISLNLDNTMIEQCTAMSMGNVYSKINGLDGIHGILGRRNI